MDNATLIDHGPAGDGRSVSEIPLVRSLLSSSASCSWPPLEQEQPPTGNPSGGNNASPAAATEGQPSSSSPSSSSAPAAPAIATPVTTDQEDISKLDLAIMACNMSLVVPMTILYVKDLGSSSWETPWKLLFFVLLVLSFLSTTTAFFTARCPAVWWARRLSPYCARFGLINAAALFVVFLACKLGRFGCAAGVGAAALVVLVLAVVWACSERRAAATGPAHGGAAVS